MWRPEVKAPILDFCSCIFWIFQSFPGLEITSRLGWPAASWPHLSLPPQGWNYNQVLGIWIQVLICAASTWLTSLPKPTLTLYINKLSDVCMTLWVCMHTHTDTHINTTHTYTYMCIHIHTHIYTYACTHIYTHALTYTHVCVHICMHIHSRVHNKDINADMCTHYYMQVSEFLAALAMQSSLLNISPLNWHCAEINSHVGLEPLNGILLHLHKVIN